MRKNLTEPLLHVDAGASTEKAICYNVWRNLIRDY